MLSHLSILIANKTTYSKASGYTVFGSWKKTFISKTVHHEVCKNLKNPCKIHIKCLKWAPQNFRNAPIFTKNPRKSAKIRGDSNPHKSAKIQVSQVFLEPIQNRVSPRSVHLEAAYLKALLYICVCMCVGNTCKISCT